MGWPERWGRLAAALALAAGLAARAMAQEESPEEPPGYFAESGEARGRAVAAKRGIELDIDDVRAAQDSELADQARDDGRAAWFAPSDGAVLGSLDAFHDRTFLLLDNLVRTLDLSWALSGDYDAELSSLALAPMVRAGGRGNDGDSAVKLKVRADVALPGVERRFHLIFDNAGREHLPGADPMRHEDDWRLGVKSAWNAWTGAKFDLGGGVRIRSLKPVGFADAALKWDWAAAGGRLELSPRVVYHTDSRWGHDVHLSWQRWFGLRSHWGVAFVVAEEHSEHRASFDFEQTVKIARAQGSRQSRGWVFQASLFPSLPERHHGGLFLDDALLAVSWKSAVYRRWLYATLTPQVDFADEDRHHPRFSFRLGFEILFGGEARRLL